MTAEELPNGNADPLGLADRDARHRVLRADLDAGGLLEKIRFAGRKARLVALIYVAVLVISAGLRLMGWGLD